MSSLRLEVIFDGVADKPPGTRTNGSSMSALPWSQQLRPDLVFSVLIFVVSSGIDIGVF